MKKIMCHFYGLILCICMTSLIGSCGGGAGSPSVNATNTTTNLPSSVAKYAGAYLSTCSAISGATLVTSTGTVYARLYQVISSSNTASAYIEWRLEFFDNSACSGNAIAFIENKNASNTVTVLNSVTASGKLADQVVLHFGAANAANTPATVASVIIGTAIQINVPAALLLVADYTDIWYTEAASLFDGGSTYGADGYPLTLRLDQPYTRLNGLLPPPPAACPTASRNWTVNSASCSSTSPLIASASGKTLLLKDDIAPTLGSAEFTCTNGTWSMPTNALCADTTPPVTTLPPIITVFPIPTSCTQETVSWTIGQSTCVGQTPSGTFPLNSNAIILNTSLVSNGSILQICSSTGHWTPQYYGATCVPDQITPTSNVDPLQLATAKNCMLCHALNVTTLGPSFKEIANYYRNNPNARALATYKIKNGGNGIFGTIPMPPNVQVNDADISILVPWILSQ